MTAPRSYNIDSIDKQILRLVVKDARLSMRAIGREIGMSPGAVAERINRLEEMGIILGYHAAVQRSAVGFEFDVLIGISARQGADIEETVAQLAQIPQIGAIHVVTGRWDLVVLAHATTHRHLDYLIEQIWKLDGIREMETQVILRSYRQPHAWLTSLAEDGSPWSPTGSSPGR